MDPPNKTRNPVQSRWPAAAILRRLRVPLMLVSLPEHSACSQTYISISYPGSRFTIISREPEVRSPKQQKRDSRTASFSEKNKCETGIHKPGFIRGVYRREAGIESGGRAETRIKQREYALRPRGSAACLQTPQEKPHITTYSRIISL